MKMKPQTPKDDAEQFDNRYLARLPSAAAIAPFGFERVLHVVADARGPIEEDVATVLREWRATLKLPASAGAPAKPLELRTLSLNAFEIKDSQVSFGGTEFSEVFYVVYSWIPGHRTRDGVVIDRGFCAQVYPNPNALKGAAPAASLVGVVPVMVAGAGLILGAKLLSGGSWRRAEGWGDGRGSGGGGTRTSSGGGGSGGSSSGGSGGGGSSRGGFSFWGGG